MKKIGAFIVVAAVASMIGLAIMATRTHAQEADRPGALYNQYNPNIYFVGGGASASNANALLTSWAVPGSIMILATGGPNPAAVGLLVQTNLWNTNGTSIATNWASGLNAGTQFLYLVSYRTNVVPVGAWVSLTNGFWK
jgi:hypothetical protein